LQLKQFQPDALQSLDDYRCHPFHQVIAEHRVMLALFAQARPVKENRRRRLDCPRVEMPVIRRKKPRSAQDVVFSDKLNQRSGFVIAPGFKRDFALANQVKAVCRIALAENSFVPLELFKHRRVHQSFQVVGFHSGDESMRGNGLGQSWRDLGRLLSNVFHILYEYSVRNRWNPAIRTLG
jgi:hypothetical protein